MYSIGEMIAVNRKKKGYSQAALADALNQAGIKATFKSVSNC